jgi:hypothetical protein
MPAVHVCGPLQRVVPALADAFNGDDPAPQAITVGDTVFYFIPSPPADLVRHELEHVFQAEAMAPRWLRWWPWLAKRVGWARFWRAYAEEHARNGYRNNRFEVAARKAAGQE